MQKTSEQRHLTCKGVKLWSVISEKTVLWFSPFMLSLQNVSIRTHTIS